MAAPARSSAHRRSKEPHGGDDGDPRHQKYALVDAAQDLRGCQHANRQIPAPVRHGAMPRQDRQRNPERELELQVIEVLEPVRRKRKQHPAEQACRRRSRQLAHQHVGTQSAGGKRGNQRQVVDHHGVEARRVKGRQRNAGQDHRIRVRQRVVMRIEDVRVEQMQRRGAQLVRDPREPPHREVRVAVFTNRAAGVQDQRVRVDQRHGDEERHHQRTPPHGCDGSTTDS